MGRGFLHVSARDKSLGPWAEASGGAGSWVASEGFCWSLFFLADNGPQEVLILDSVTVTLYGKKDFADGIQ